MYHGNFILFFQQGELLSAVCIQDEGAHLQLLCTGGARLRLPAQRVVHAQPVDVAADGDTARVLERLADVEACQQRLAGEIDPAVLRAALPGASGRYSPPELARAAFGDAAGPDHAAAVVRALKNERVHFKFDGRSYQALDEHQIEQARTRAQQEQALRDELERCASYLRAYLHDGAVDEPARAACAQYLRQFAVFGTAAPQFSHIRSIFRKAGVTPDRRACFDLLVRMGVCARDENLLLERYGVPRAWPEDALREAEGPACAQTPLRRDETALPAWSIDDPGTRDIDDAVSFEHDGAALRLGIHITDAASMIPPGCALDREAALRGTSLYLPDGTLPMLPPELSEKRLSLVAGQARPVLSVFVLIDPDGAVRERSLQLSTIRVAQRLSYADVDEDIGAGGMFHRLHEVLACVRALRLASGASGAAIPELQVRLNREREVVLSLRERESPAQALVAECMILANHSAALFLRRQGLPALYRTQKPSRAASAVSGADMPLHERVRLRHDFSRPVIETRARPHAGLGLDCYCSITSPLRKYLDLVMQRQLAAAVLEDTPVYSDRQLREIASQLQPVLNRAWLVESERRRYWLFKKMEPLRGSALPAVVLGRRRKDYAVLLSDFLLEAHAAPAAERTFEPGCRAQVLLREIDPFEGTISLQLI